MAKPNFVNGKECEWADVTVNIAGAPTVKFTDIKYGVATAKTHLHAGGDDPIGIQSGNKEPKGSITLLKGAFDALNAAALLAGGRDLTDVELDIVVHYLGKGGRIPKTDTIVGVQFSDFEKAMAQGDPKMEVVLPFLYLRLVQL